MGMVKTYATLCLAALSLLAACSKEDEKPSGSSVSNDYFTAVITPYSTPGKTYIATGDGSDYSCWANGDAVNINGTSRTVTVSGDADSYTATIDADGIDAIADGYLAAYPAGRVSQNSGTAATFAWPETTCYATVASGAGAGKQSVEAPMVAYTTQRSLAFENVGLLTQFALKQSGSSNVKLKSISLITDQPIRGTYTIAYDGSGWTRTATGLDGYRRVLLCSEPLSLSSTAQSFYLSLPPVTGASTFTVEILLTVDGVRHRFSRTKSGTIGLEAGKCYDFGTLTYNVDSKTLTDHNSNEYTEVIPAGTESDPYPIKNASEWYYWCNAQASNSNAYFLLEDNFSVGETISEICGTVDGNGHTVTVSNCALIGHLNGGTVKNITTEGTITTYEYPVNSQKVCGAIAAYATDVTLINCTNKANISITTTENTFYLGGLIGSLKNTSSAEINGCRNEGDIVGSSSITTTTFTIGGLVGATTGFSTHIINCCNKGTIQHSIRSTHENSIGGIVGRMAGTNNKIENCYSIGAIIGTNSGSNGDNRGGITSSTSTTYIIQNCYCFSNDTTLNLCYNNSGTIRFCYHSGTNTRTTGNVGVDCNNLRNATTINRSEPNNLSNQLNSNIGTLNIAASAWSWTEVDGCTVFDH